MAEPRFKGIPVEQDAAPTEAPAPRFKGEAVTPAGAVTGRTAVPRRATEAEQEAGREKMRPFVEAGLTGAGAVLTGGAALAPAATRFGVSKAPAIARTAEEAYRAARTVPPLITRAATPMMERYVVPAAEAMVPKTLSEAAKMATAGGATAALSEAGGRAYEKATGTKQGRSLAEMLTGMAPAALTTSAQRALAPAVKTVAERVEKTGGKIGEKIKERLYTIPEDIKSNELTQAIDVLRSKDISVLPSEIRNSMALKAVERIFQMFPGSKQEFTKFGNRNQEAINLDIAKAFGSLDPRLNPQAMNEAKSSLNKAYTDVLGGKEFTVSPENVGLFRKAFAENEQLKDFVLGNRTFERFAQNINEGKTIPADLWKEVRGELSSLVYGLDKGSSAKRIGKQVLQGFDDIAAKNLSAEDLAALRATDKKYAALMVFEDAYKRSGGNILKAGNVDLKNFVNQYKGINPDNILYGRETGRGGDYSPLVSAADIYRVYTTAKIPETQATTLGGLGRVATGTSFLAGGMSGIPGLAPVGTAMLVGPSIARRAAQAYLRPEEIGKGTSQAMIERAQRMREAAPSPYSVIVPTVESQKE